MTSEISYTLTQLSVSHDSVSQLARNKLKFATVYTDVFQLARNEVSNYKKSKLFSDDGITIVLQDVNIKVDMLLIVQINEPIIDLSATTPRNIELPSSVISTVYNTEKNLLPYIGFTPGFT